MTRTRFRHLIALRRRHNKAESRVPTPVNPHRKQTRYSRPGKIKGALLMWLLGVPIPLILLFFLIKGCVT